MDMQKLWQRTAIGGTIFVSSAIALAACPPHLYQEGPVAAAFVNSGLIMSAGLATVDTQIAALMEFYSQRLTSAVAVLTKQKAVSANLIAEANKNSAQMTAEGLKIIGQTRRVKTAAFEYSGAFGQGYDPCYVYESRTLMTNREGDVTDERRRRVTTEVNAAPGRYADPVDTMYAMAKEHREKFCTEDQVKSGMCDKVGEMAGKSLDAATLFEPAQENEPLYQAKLAFINNVAPLPDGPIPKEVAKGAATQAYVLAKAQKDALSSTALTSLKEVQMEYTGVVGDHGGDLPFAVRLDGEVKRYFGNTNEHTSWVKVMIGQNTRGLMVEMLKIKALDLMLMERQYRQYERMEANLATLVAGELRQEAARSREAGEQAATDETKRQIK